MVSPVEPPVTAASDHPSQAEQTRPVSERRLAANRANAQRSTGPNTEQGKSRARLNATKHGLRGSLPPDRTPELSQLLDEDPRAYRKVRRALFKDLRPQGAAEVLLVERVARAAWRLRRAEAVEIELLDTAEAERVEGVAREDRKRERECRRPLPETEYEPKTLTSALVDQFRGNADAQLLRLAGYQARLEGLFRAALRDLRQLRKGRAKWEGDVRNIPPHDDDGSADNRNRRDIPDVPLPAAAELCVPREVHDAAPADAPGESEHVTPNEESGAAPSLPRRGGDSTDDRAVVPHVEAPRTNEPIEKTETVPKQPPKTQEFTARSVVAQTPAKSSTNRSLSASKLPPQATLVST
jgi:hypothetical protein